MNKTRFQSVRDLEVDRRDHVWFVQNEIAKCVLCGAVTRKVPPYPTPEDWTAIKYEPLTDKERDMCPAIIQEK